ncbi:MAG TPA: lysozyme inhibitor LprI family protein [Flavobacterium sp.]|nr:lysozyme inhibitor LprI family protein [Flavobacterium sp.]
MTKKHFLLFVLILLGSSYNLAAQTQLEMNKAADAEYKKADAELNKVYRQLVEMLDKNGKQMLIIAEKDWLKFRDSHCRFNASQFDGGSIEPLIYSTCLEELTRRRIDEIKASIKSRDL